MGDAEAGSEPAAAAGAPGRPAEQPPAHSSLPAAWWRRHPDGFSLCSSGSEVSSPGPACGQVRGVDLRTASPHVPFLADLVPPGPGGGAWSSHLRQRKAERTEAETLKSAASSRLPAA